MREKLRRCLPARALLCMVLPLFLFLTAACSPAAEEAAQETVAAAIEEIPVTTASDKARQLYDEGLYYLDVGRGAEANERFRAAVAEDPSFVRGHFAQSNSAFSFQEFQQCLDNATPHLEGASEGERMLVDINKTFLTNNSEQGVELASQLVAKYPQSARAYIALAGQQGRHNANENARSSLGRALELDPTSAGALWGIANSYLFGEPKDFAKAEEWAAKAIAAYPEEAKGHELMGDIKRAQGDLEAALASYQAATEADPTMPNGHHKSGHINSFLGNIEEARANYDTGVATAQPQNKAGLAVFKTFTRIHEGDVPAALDEMETLAGSMEEMGTPAGQIKGLQVGVFNSHATAAMHAGLLDRAAEAVAKANELRMEIAAEVGTPDAERLQTVACHQWDGLLAAYRGDAAGAAQHADAMAALVENDDNPRKMEGVHYVLGMSALEAADHAAAVEHLRQANHANNMYIRYQLAMAEEGAGNSAEAQKLFAEVGSFNFNSIGFALAGRDARQRSST